MASITAAQDGGETLLGHNCVTVCVCVWVGGCVSMNTWVCVCVCVFTCKNSPCVFHSGDNLNQTRYEADGK